MSCSLPLGKAPGLILGRGCEQSLVSSFAAEVFNRQDKTPLQNFLDFCTTIGNIQTGSLKDYDEHSLEIQDEKEINLWF